MQSSQKTAREFVRKHRPDYQIILLSGILMLLGLIVLYAISPARVEVLNAAGDSSLDQAHFMQRQLLYLILGVAAFAFAAKVPLGFWQKNAGKILLAGLGSCLLLAILGLASTPLALCAGGACRWFNLGFITFQPAELVKFGLVLFLAGFLGAKASKNKINDLKETLLPLAVLMAVTMFFVIGIQKDMGTGLAIFGIVLTMLFVAGMNRKTATYVVMATVALGAMFIVIAPHRIARVVTFLGNDTAKDITGSAYHITQAKIALGSGGVFGLGLGKNVQSFGYLPEAPNDSIFAIMGEAFGFIGLLAILALLVALLLRLLHIVARIENMSLRLIVTGVFGWLAVHTLINIGSVVGVIPLTGITLPLLSFGGTSLLFTMLALGLVFNVSRFSVHGKIIDDDAQTQTKNSDSWRRLRRTRQPSYSRN